MRFKNLFSTIIAFAFCGILSAQIDFYANDTMGCEPLSIKFSLDHTTIDTNTIDSVVWNFGIGRAINSFNPANVRYSQPGKYTVSIVVYGSTTSTITKTNYIVVHEVVSADFDFDITNPLLGYQFNPLGTIISDTTSFLWEIFDDASDRISNITYPNKVDPNTAVYDYDFPDTGSYSVKLKVTTNWTEGTQTEHCVDSSLQVVLVREIPDTADNDSVFVVGNVFSPETQDYFVIAPTDPDITLSFIVFSRNGVVVYKQESPVIYWDGRTNSGRDLDTGVYFYVLEALHNDPSKYYSKRGFIHLFR
jgi:hypothetical protein